MDPFEAKNQIFINKLYSNKNDILNRAFGCIFGAFIGDAAGAVLEFMEVTKIFHSNIDKAMQLEGGGIIGMGKG